MKTNRNFWRVLVLALALVMMFAIVACSNDKDDAAATTEGAVDTTAAPTTEKATKATKDPNATTEPKTTVTTEATTEPIPVIGDSIAKPSNGVNYVFYKALPAMFVTEATSEGTTEATTEAATEEALPLPDEKVVIEIAAADYDKTEGVSAGVKEEGTDVKHYYLDPAVAEAVIVWNFKVEDNGYYEFCLQMRLNDADKHGATILVDGEDLCKLDFQFKDTEYPQIVDDAATQNTWVAGFGKELTAGNHTISIKGLAETKPLELRKLYITKNGALVVEKPSKFDNDGDGQNDNFTFSSAMPEIFKTQGTIQILAKDYIQEGENASVGVGTAMDGLIRHYYVDFIEPAKNQTLTPDQQAQNTAMVINWKFEVKEDGYYDMCIQMRMKDGKERGNTVIIDGTKICDMSFQFEGTTYVDIRDNDKERNAWMTGFGANLKAGEHILSFKGVPTILKTMHIRVVYLTKTADYTPAA